MLKHTKEHMLSDLGTSPYTFTNLAEGDHVISICVTATENPIEIGTYNIRVKVEKPNGEVF